MSKVSRRTKVIEELALLHELSRRNKEIASTYAPYQKQKNFHKSSVNYAESCLMAGNQCLTYDSLVDTPNGQESIGSLFEAGDRFKVWSWNGNERVVMNAEKPFKVGREECFSFGLSNGQYLECSAGHMILSGSDWYPAKFLAKHLREHASNTPLFGGISIYSCEDIGTHDVYDFQVPVTNNYFSSGIVSHNCGKTFCAVMEIYYHATGLYPDWWEGVVFETAPVMWVCGETGEVIRDTTQKYLIDRPGKLEGPDDDYTGILPKRYVIDTKKANGGNGLLDYLIVKHVTGKSSYIYFKAYSKGREKFQGETIDIIFFDEEPPEEIYSEGITRTNNGQHGRMAKLTFTPLKGMSNVVYSFMKEPTRAQKVINMTIYDVGHYTVLQREDIVDGYPAHEKEARSKGIPIMGSGRVYTVTEESIREPRVEEVPGWWRQLAGMDFGIEHPTASVLVFHDPDTDTIHLRSTFKSSGTTPLMFAQGIKTWGDIPFAWPHDGLQRDKGSGLQLAKQYRTAGIQMMQERATFDDGTNGVEAGITEILDRMKSGRFKVDESLTDWWDEFRIYHRKDGIIVKKRDDLLDATRYAIMMLRNAITIRETFTTESLTPQPVEDF